MKTKLILFAFVAISLYSCQNEFSIDDVPLVNSPDSTRLSKYIEFDTTQVSGLDTLDISNYNYDNLQRLTLQEYTEFDGAGVKVNLYKAFLYYNGTDTLPFKTIRNRYSLPGLNLQTSDTSFYSFANGKIVSDSNSFGVTKFSYSNNLIFEKRYSSFPGMPIDSNTFYMTRLNGNLVLQIDTLSGGSEVENFSFTYDNKNNPFHRLPISSFERLRPYYKLELYNDEMIYEKNNPTQILQTNTVSLFHFKYAYEYNANGYPKIARVTDQTNPSTFYKVKFFYTAL